VALEETDLRVPRAVAGRRACGGAPGGAAVVLGRFGEQPAGVALAPLGDVPAVLLIAAGVLAGGDPEPGRELAGVREASEVADLGDQPERGRRRDPAKRPELLGLPRPPVMSSDVLETGVKRGKLAVEAVEMGQHLRERLVCERIIAALATHPRAVLHGPRPLAVKVDPAVTQQLPSDAVARRGLYVVRLATSHPLE
jgi:hypothetical protein